MDFLKCDTHRDPIGITTTTSQLSLGKITIHAHLTKHLIA
jgi:hypothetical protein